MSNYTGYIYSITNKVNGKTYIGKTNDLVRRWKEHYYGKGGAVILKNALKKYGVENFLFDVIAKIPFDTKEELNDVLKQLEIYYISLYDTFHNGYNATIGGDGISYYEHSEETKQKLKERQIEKWKDEEFRAKCAIAALGYHHTDKAKEAIRQALLSRDHSIYDKVSAKLKGRKRDNNMIMRAASKRRKPVLQYDMNGNFVHEYPGAKFAVGFERKAISSCCRGKLYSTGGYIWRFKESDNFPRKIDVPVKWQGNNKNRKEVYYVL